MVAVYQVNKSNDATHSSTFEPHRKTINMLHLFCLINVLWVMLNLLGGYNESFVIKHATKEHKNLKKNEEKKTGGVKIPIQSIKLIKKLFGFN